MSLFGFGGTFLFGLAVGTVGGLAKDSPGVLKDGKCFD